VDNLNSVLQYLCHQLLDYKYQLDIKREFNYLLHNTTQLGKWLAQSLRFYHSRILLDKLSRLMSGNKDYMLLLNTRIMLTLLLM
jgi:hypothetical protein